MITQTALLIWIVMAALLTGGSLSTKCYVCGDNSSVSDQCVDEYPTGLREKDQKDCSESKVEGCMKSKYVDQFKNQIVTRSCAPEMGMSHTPNECKTTEVAGNEVFFCHCTGDFCNSSSINYYSLLLIGIAAAVSLLSSQRLL